MQEVAAHYHHFGGVSPINGHNRALVAALRQELVGHGLHLPVYWGNRNWHPLLAATVSQMKADGVHRALAFATSGFASYSSCRQYLDDLAQARADVGPGAPDIDKLRLFYNHPGFIEPMAEQLRAGLEQAAGTARVAFTAHSIPVSMAKTSAYEQQLREASRLVADAAGLDEWELVYQSRSGPPSQPWLEPSVEDFVRTAAHDGVDTVVTVPIGFTSDHMEVAFDLDVEARDLAGELGLQFVRVPTVGAHPRFVTMIRQLIEERLDPTTPKLALGNDGPHTDYCPPGCCPAPSR
jgi:ferrochelatase